MKQECLTCPVFERAFKVYIPGLKEVVVKQGKCDHIFFFTLKANDNMPWFIRREWEKFAYNVFRITCGKHRIYPPTALSGTVYINRKITVAYSDNPEVFYIVPGAGCPGINSNTCSK